MRSLVQSKILQLACANSRYAGMKVELEPGKYLGCVTPSDQDKDTWICRTSEGLADGSESEECL